MKKYIKIWALSFLAWQIVTLFYKDEEFKNSFKNAKWIEKCKVLFNSLKQLNGKLINDLLSIDYQEKVNDFTKVFEEKRKILEEKLNEIRENINQYKQEKLDVILADLQQKADELKSEINSQIVSLNEKLKLEEKVKKIVEKIEEIKSKIS